MAEEYPLIMTVREVCDALLIGKDTVYELIRSGEIKSFRTGHSWKIPSSELFKFINSKVS